jgi:Xaa-Pro aminopeptidase
MSENKLKLKIAFGIVILLIGIFPTVANNKTDETKSNSPGLIRITPPAPKFTDLERQMELAKRRQSVAGKIGPNGILILFSAEPRIYTNDVDYEFRQENNLYYLTMLKQKGAKLVLIPGADNGIKEVIFLPKRNPQFETWNGKMYSPEEAARISGIKTVLDEDEFETFIEELKKKQAFTSKSGVKLTIQAVNLFLLLPLTPGDSDGSREFGQESAFAEMINKNASAWKIQNAQPIFANLRLIKSPMELKLLQHAIDITIEAQMRAMATVGNAKWEYEVEAEVEYTFRRRNADYWGYPSIVGCGPNATTLHYEESQGEVKPGDLLLMDVGAEYEHYTADVTRTFPVNGKFTKEQAEIYQIVFDAQEAAARAIKPGATMGQVNTAATEVIKDGLFRLGLITDKNSEQYTLWFMHGTSHWLGMNVHDVGNYFTAFKPGMVFTNEPGIYIREDALEYLPKNAKNDAFLKAVRTAFEKYKNIGVRIEDDMLVTETGTEWMTKNLPRKINEIESFMAQASKEFKISQWQQKNLYRQLFIRNSMLQPRLNGPRG